MTTGVYLLHFLPSYKHAKHYLGFADNIEPRIYAHHHGRGARLTQVARDAGINMILVRIWEGADRTTERQFKNRSHVPKLCPICKGAPVQLPLFGWMPAYVLLDEEIVTTLAPAATDERQLVLNLFDIDAATEELIEGREDEEFWRRGNW